MLRDALSALGWLRHGSRSSPGPLPEAAAGLRPGEAGTALAGGARPSHLAATLIDLGTRGYVRIERCASGDDLDFVLTRCANPAGSLARYERTLLRGLPRGPGHRLSQLKTTKKWVKAIGRVYRQLNREAILRGWVRPAQPDDARRDGEAADDPVAGTRKQLRTFRQYLNGLVSNGPGTWETLRDYLPYAVAFGLMPEWSGRFPGPPGHTTDGALSANQGGGLNQYALAAAFSSAACAHVHSVASHSGFSGAGGHHAGGVSGHGGHVGGGHVGGGHGGFGGHF